MKLTVAYSHSSRLDRANTNEDVNWSQMNWNDGDRIWQPWIRMLISKIRCNSTSKNNRTGIWTKYFTIKRWFRTIGQRKRISEHHGPIRSSRSNQHPRIFSMICWMIWTRHSTILCRWQYPPRLRLPNRRRRARQRSVQRKHNQCQWPNRLLLQPDQKWSIHRRHVWPSKMAKERVARWWHAVNRLRQRRRSRFRRLRDAPNREERRWRPLPADNRRQEHPSITLLMLSRHQSRHGIRCEVNDRTKVVLPNLICYLNYLRRIWTLAQMWSMI